MKKLYRSKQNRVWLGILGGLGEYANIDPTVLRVIFIILLFVTGIFPFAVAYLVSALIIPEPPSAGNDSYDSPIHPS